LQRLATLASQRLPTSPRRSSLCPPQIYNTAAPHAHISTLASKATTDLAKADPKGLVERDPCTAISFLHNP